MDGREIVKIIENELFLKEISKTEFYEACSMNSATLSNWRAGKFKPTPQKLAVIEDYLGISFDDYESSASKDPESDELLEMLRERPDLRILLRSGKDVPPSSIYQLISIIEKEKEDAQ